jgi:hypothetical protein
MRDASIAAIMIRRRKRTPGRSTRYRFHARALGLLAVACHFGAAAQVLPSTQLPGLPRTQLPVDVGGTLDAAQRTANQPLDELRKVRLDGVLERNRDRLERNPRGELIVRREVVAVSPTPEALALAAGAGFSIARRRSLDALGLETVVLVAPVGLSETRALKRLRKLDPAGTYEYNHVYTGSDATANSRATATSQATAPAQATPGPAVAATTSADGAASPGGVRLGLIDGGVDWRHPLFVHVRHDDWGCDGTITASAHGTAVASLLAGELGPERASDHGALRDETAGSSVDETGTRIFAADVYCGTEGAAAVDSLAAAFGWLVTQRVAVINVSLVGPPNRLLEQVVAKVVAHGQVVVAAVGNDGPSAPPLYPAAYPEVVGVTAVDAQRRALLEAGRGPQVDFAALGADLDAASLAGAIARVRGTSFAAPLVAAHLARDAIRTDPAAANGAVERLAAIAIDLGAKGRDPIYGLGLVPTLRQLATESPSAGAAEEKSAASRMNP